MPSSADRCSFRTCTTATTRPPSRHTPSTPTTAPLSDLLERFRPATCRISASRFGGEYNFIFGNIAQVAYSRGNFTYNGVYSNVPARAAVKRACRIFLSCPQRPAPTAICNQPAFNGGTTKFHPYPYVYNTVLARLLAEGVPYRMTEANDCLHGVVGASDGFAAALWALDYMH